VTSATRIEPECLSHTRTAGYENGKDVAAVVPLRDLALLETLEDRMDLKEVHEALNEKDNRAFESSCLRGFA
jgi:hypothetical protein